MFVALMLAAAVQGAMMRRRQVDAMSGRDGSRHRPWPVLEVHWLAGGLIFVSPWRAGTAERPSDQTRRSIMTPAG